MKINDIKFILKDGREAVLRSPLEEDIEGVLRYLYVSAGETEFIIRYPEECGRYTYEGEKEVFKRWEESPLEMSLVCLVDGVVAGNCNVSFGKSIKTRHRGSIGIALMKEYWGLGIGSRMFDEMIKTAEKIPDVKQLELEFVEGNSRAHALYEKKGFRIVSCHPDAVCLKDGSMRNEYLMIKKLDK